MWLQFELMICAVYLEYIVTIHFVCSYPISWPYIFSGIYHELTLYVQYTKKKVVKKRFPFERICAVYLEYILTIHFVCPYQNLLTLYVQYTKIISFKKWLPLKLICAHLAEKTRKLWQIWNCDKLRKSNI